MENGLVSNQVKVIYQDWKGFMWIGTQTGLQRYDGNRFTTYLADIHDRAALQTDWISAIFEDSKHRLWIGTAHGAPYIFNRNTEKFYNYNLHVSAGNKKVTGIWQFLESGKGEVWLTSNDGYYKLNENTNQFEDYNQRLGIEKNIWPALLTIDKDDNIWIATTGGLKFYNRKENKLYSKNYNPSHLPVFEIKESLANVVLDNYDNIWINTAYHQNLYRYNFKTKNQQVYSFDKPVAKRLGVSVQKENLGMLTKDSKGNILISLFTRGIAVYDHYTNTFSIIDPANSMPSGLHLDDDNFSASYIFDDREANLWIGTNLGINICNPGNQKFFTYGLYKNSKDSIPAITADDIVQTKEGNVYVGYYFVNGGIVCLDSNLNFKHHYLFKENGSLNTIINQVWNLFLDDKGIIWAPNQRNTILQLNTATGQLEELKDTALRGPLNIIKQDAANDIWIGHWYKGLYKIDHQTKKISCYRSFIHPELSSTQKVYCLFFDDEKIWVGTNQNGLQVFDKKKEIFTEAFVANERITEAISSNSIYDIIGYNKDTLIIATEAGINIFDKRSKKFRLLSSKDGLPNNLVQAIVLDKHKNLWAAFAGGFCKISMHNFAVTNYGINDGIIDNIFNNKFCILRDGRFLIGANKSFMAFNPDSMLEAKPPPDVTITGFSVFENKLPVDSLINNNKPVSLSYRENSMHIEFATLQFNSSENIKYYYQLTGVDKDWIRADNEPGANYNQLDNGNYVFKIKCANRDGVFCKNITLLSINIAPPYWKTWWFRLLMLALIMASIYFFISWREKRIYASNQQKLIIEQLSAEQYRNKLEMEKIINYFSFSLVDKTTVDDVLWDVAKNLIGKLEFIDCIIYLWNDDKSKLIQRAGYGEKGSLEEMEKQYFEILPGEGVVGYVCQTKEAVMIGDTSKDKRYRQDETFRYSELAVPVIYNDELIGVIDTEHHLKNFFTQRHLQLLTTIAAMVATKINVIESERLLRRQKAELTIINQQLSDIQLAALRSQMNPHFIFNALNSIKLFVMENDSINAEKYLDKFARLIRSILDTTQSGTVLLQNEIDMLRLYLDLEQLRFSDKLTYLIAIDESINPDNISIPSMLIQPYVENAILHGIMHKETGGFVEVRFKLFGSWIEITIEDNGVGRERSKTYKNKTTHNSLSMEITNKRLQRLKHDDITHAGITIIDLKDGRQASTGTKVIIEVPL